MITAIDTVVLCVFIIYLIVSILIFMATLTRDKSLAPEEYPFVSVVIAVRNEEKNILDCLRSLKKQNYPEDKYEVIIVDDHSTDRTPLIVKNEINSLNHFKYTKLPENISRKRNALIFGIQLAKGEYILQIDGDCIAQKHWMSELCAYLGRGYAIVGGYTSICYRKKWLEKLQAIEYFYLLSTHTLLSRFIRTYSLFGNNLAFKRSVYEQTQGYQSIHNEILEDYQLVKLFLKNTPNKGRLIFNSNSIILTQPKEGYKNYFLQKRLWGSGIPDAKIVSKFFFFFLILVHSILTIYILFSKYVFLILLMRLLSDFLIVFNPLRIFRHFKLIPYFVFYHINIILTLILAGISLIFYPKTKWKGRTIG